MRRLRSGRPCTVLLLARLYPILAPSFARHATFPPRRAAAVDHKGRPLHPNQINDMSAVAVSRLAVAALSALVAVAIAYAVRGQTVAAAGAASAAPCPLSPITIASTIPQDSSQTSQTYFDCFAWQEFIGLNWDASPSAAGSPDPNASPAGFGEPLDYNAPVL